MFPLAQASQQKYDHVPTSETLSDSEYLDEKSLDRRSRPRPWSTCAKVAAIVGAVAIGLVLAFTLGYVSAHQEISQLSPTESVSPVIDHAPDHAHGGEDAHVHEHEDVHAGEEHDHAEDEHDHLADLDDEDEDDHDHDHEHGHSHDQEHNHGHSHAHESDADGEGDENHHHHSHDNECSEPRYRKEWRSLSKVEKKDYLDAVQCMIDSRSILGLNGTLYDDFAWAHNKVARSTHTKAPFLTWHRRFIYVYEDYLRAKCHYKGSLPYWDWSLDWEEPTASPIFDSELGFGGDGDPAAPKHNAAHCVTDSPFKNLRPQWSGDKFEPHCLARFFEEDWLAHYLNPESVEEIMTATTYDEFYLKLEMRAHDIIPMGIRGDFTAFTAPNDPIFYLHHAQLDRLWWLWQLRDKKNRLSSYGGLGLDGNNVTLSDSLPLSGLDRDVSVQQIMSTEGGGMCYRYMYT